MNHVSRLVQCPEVLWRVGRLPDPMAMPPAPDPMEISPEPVTNGGRWDDPEGRFATLYCGSTAEACFGETIACFRERSGFIERMEDSFEAAAESEHDFEIVPGLVPRNYVHSRGLAKSTLAQAYFCIDIDHSETLANLDYALQPLLHAHHLKAFDLGVVMGQDRRLTRPIARHYQEMSLTPDHRNVAGISYRTRLGLDLGWECWALFQKPMPLFDPLDVEVRPVSWSDPALVSAAVKLGLRLPH